MGFLNYDNPPEEGKFYKTRSGQKVECISYDKYLTNFKRLNGEIILDDDGYAIRDAETLEMLSGIKGRIRMWNKSVLLKFAWAEGFTHYKHKDKIIKIRKEFRND